MGTKNNPGQYDCYAHAEDDEPMFVLLARDPLAPILVKLWASMHQLTKPDGLFKRGEARRCAKSMTAWRNKNRADT